MLAFRSRTASTTFLQLQRTMATYSKNGAVGDVAFVGLGAMGWGMAANLAKHHPDNKVLVWNRTTSVAQQHASEFGTHAVSSLEELRGCPLVFTCLPTSVEVESICDRLVLDAGAIVADCTSGDPHTTQRIATKLGQRQIKMVDCPVSGGPAGARSGQLASMVGGDDASVSTIEPYLKTMAHKQVVPVGPIGSGHAVKAINNALNTAHLVIATEGLLALSKFGISPEVALDAINGSSGRSLQTQERIPKEVLTRDFDYGFKLGLMLKDVSIADSVCAEGLTGDEEIPKFIPMVKDILQKAVDMESEDADYTQVIRPLEVEAGIELHGESSYAEKIRKAA